MKLTLEQISAAARGAVRVEENDGKVCLCRFTSEQVELYRVTNTDFYNKSFATAGVILEFLTDSATLSLEVEVCPGSSRNFFAHSIYVNGKRYATLDCRRANRGVFGGKWTLPDGEKQIKIYFPWSVASRIIDLSLDDGATFTPVVKEKKMIMFGDSITHGYDARQPENAYAVRIAEALDANAINKGIGAERFFPPLAELRDPIEPDYITVAYGTNDWSRGDKEGFETKSRDFYAALSKNYPNAKIFALTPIWRGNYGAENAIGTLDAIGEHIKNVTADLPNVTVINGIDFIPHDSAFFAIDVVHPNDNGFEHYFNNLLNEIKKHI